MNKNQLRQLGKDIRAGISDDQRGRDEKAIKDNILTSLRGGKAAAAIQTDCHPEFISGSKSHKILKQVQDDCYSLNIGIYYSIGTEISVIPAQAGILDTMNQKDSSFGWNDNIEIALPVIRNDKSLEFYPWKEGDRLVTREFNIPIPDTRHLSPVRPDVILAPLLLCDLQGNRLGYGKGHYDRYISSLDVKPLLVGICFDEQIYEGALPAEDHDVRLDMIITPKRTVDLR